MKDYFWFLASDFWQSCSYYKILTSVGPFASVLHNYVCSYRDLVITCIWSNMQLVNILTSLQILW